MQISPQNSEESIKNQKRSNPILKYTGAGCLFLFSLIFIPFIILIIFPGPIPGVLLSVCLVLFIIYRFRRTNRLVIRAGLVGLFIGLSFMLIQITPNFLEAAKGLFGNEIEELIIEGEAYLEAEDYDSAFDVYSQAIELDSNSAAAYTGRGEARYYAADDTSLALQDINKAIQLDNEYAPAYRIRGIIHRNQEGFSQAMSDFNRALELDPDYATVYVSRGILLESEGNYQAAYDDYTHSISLDDSEAWAFYYRGNLLLYQMGDFESAAIDFQKALESDPKFASAYGGLGRIHFEKQGYKDAIDMFSKGLDIYPDYAYAYYYRGRAYLHRGQYSNAISDFNNVIRTDEGFFYTQYFLAVAYDQSGDTKAAYGNYLDFLDSDQSDNHYTRYACDRVNFISVANSKDLLSALLNFAVNPCNRFDAPYEYAYDDDSLYRLEEYCPGFPYVCDSVYSPAQQFDLVVNEGK